MEGGFEELRGRTGNGNSLDASSAGSGLAEWAKLRGGKQATTNAMFAMFSQWAQCKNNNGRGERGGRRGCAEGAEETWAWALYT
jgi:hypothetical protein